MSSVFFLVRSTHNLAVIAAFLQRLPAVEICFPSPLSFPHALFCSRSNRGDSVNSMSRPMQLSFSVFASVRKTSSSTESIEFLADSASGLANRAIFGRLNLAKSFFSASSIATFACFGKSIHLVLSMLYRKVLLTLTKINSRVYQSTAISHLTPNVHRCYFITHASR